MHASLLKPGEKIYYPDYDLSSRGRKFKPYSLSAAENEEASSWSNVDGDGTTRISGSCTGRPGEDFKAASAPSMVRQNVSSVIQHNVTSAEKYNNVATETTKDLPAGHKKRPKGTRVSKAITSRES